MGIDATDDAGAIDAWIAARAGSAQTVKAYRREEQRFQLWLAVERRRALSEASAEDCTACLAFMEHVPVHWCSKGQGARMSHGWAPFRGPLSLPSRVRAVAALHALYQWLVADVNYLSLNPWNAVNRKLGDDTRELAQIDVDPSRAFSPAAWSVLMRELELNPATPSRARMRWLLEFVQATGARASELLAARRVHLIKHERGWFIRPLGKGDKHRLVPVPAPAMRATRAYFAARGLDFDQAPEATPLLATLAGGPLSYSTLHETFHRFVRRAFLMSTLPPEAKRRAGAASVRWLRHAHATRAAERGVPPDVLQAKLGQVDPLTTARYYRAQIERRHAEMERAFGDDDQ